MNDSPHTPDTPEDGVNLLDYLIVLAKHSQLIIYTPVAVMVLTFLVLFMSPNRYTATARLLPPHQNLTMSGQLMDIMGGGVKPGMGAGGGLFGGLIGLKSPADLYVGIMSCDTIADRIIDQFQLKDYYKNKSLDDTRNILRKTVKISAGKKDNMITVGVTDKNTIRAAEIANAYIKELDNLMRNLAVQEATGRLTFLERELAEANANLTKAEEAMRSFSEKNSVIQIDTQTKGMLQYIAQLRAQIDAKEVQVQVLRQQATPNNYDVVRLETQVKGLKDKLQAAEKQWDQSCIGDVCLNTSKMPMLGLEYIRLYRGVKYQETLYQLYTKMVEIARMDVVKDVAVVQVVDWATPPDKRANKRLLPAQLSAVVTFFIMVFVAFGIEHWEQMKSREDQVQRLTQIGELLRPLTQISASWRK